MAVGGAASTLHCGGSIRTDCEPNRNVEALRLALNDADIESRPLWKPMHKHPVYRQSVAYVTGVSEELFKRGLCLPSGPMVSDEDVKNIVRIIKENIAYRRTKTKTVTWVIISGMRLIFASNRQKSGLYLAE